MIDEELKSRTARDMSRNMRLFFQPNTPNGNTSKRRGDNIPILAEDQTHISE